MPSPLDLLLGGPLNAGPETLSSFNPLPPATIPPLPSSTPVRPAFGLPLLEGRPAIGPAQDVVPYLPGHDEPEMDLSSVYIPDNAPDVDYSALLEPVRTQPGFKQTLMEAIVPLLAAGVVGKFGGGMAGATGLLGGLVKGRSEAEARELEQAKMDAARRERALARIQKDEETRATRLKDRNAAVEKLLDTGMKFNSPEAAVAYYRSVAPLYAEQGIDTMKLGAVVKPQLVKAVQDDAAKVYDAAIENMRKFLAPGETLEQSALKTTITFRGKDMTIAELGRIGSRSVGGPETRRLGAKDELGWEGFVRDKLAAFEEKTGAPVTRDQRREIMLAARQEWAASDDDPTLKKLRLAQLLALDEKRRRTAAGEHTGDGLTRTYNPVQERARAALQKVYIDESKPFATRSLAWESIRGSGERAKAGNLTSQRALVFGMYKMLDPGSAVLPGEYASAANAAAVPDRIRELGNQLLKGQILTPQQIQGMMDEAAGLYKDHKKRHDGVAMQTAQQALGRGIEPWDVLRDYNANDDPMVLKGIPRPRMLIKGPAGTVQAAEDEEPAEEPAASTAAPPQIDFATAGRTPIPGVGTQAPGARVQAYAPGKAPAGAPAKPPAKDIRMGAPKTGVSVGDRVYVGSPPSWKTVTAVRGPNDFDAY
jgi:hypothetical protein